MVDTAGPGISHDLLERFRTAQSVAVLTGAGVSAESGVPTFRGGGGAAVWKGMPFSTISSAAMLEQDLPEVWRWFEYRRGVIKDLSPNPAHRVLAKWEKRFEDFSLATQNIDGLHRMAGSNKVIELHGNIHRARCLFCGERVGLGSMHSETTPPECERCGGHLRPDVVLFGEMLPDGAFEEAARKACASDLYFVIGTSALVYPAASLPEMAKAGGAYLVEVNPEPTPLSGLCDELLQGKAGELLPLFEN